MFGARGRRVYESPSENEDESEAETTSVWGTGPRVYETGVVESDSDE